jgi:hypothetical protein
MTYTNCIERHSVTAFFRRRQSPVRSDASLNELASWLWRSKPEIHMTDRNVLSCQCEGLLDILPSQQDGAIRLAERLRLSVSFHSPSIHTYIYTVYTRGLSGKYPAFWTSREQAAWPWCNLGASQRRPYCASVNSHSPVGLVSRQWDADDWACVLCD